MIFPDLPKKRYFWTQQQIDKIYQDADAIMAKMQPAQLAEDEPKQVSVDEWFQRHFPDQEIPPPVNINKEIDWNHQSTWEFILIVVGFAFWVAYWYQLK